MGTVVTTYNGTPEPTLADGEALNLAFGATGEAAETVIEADTEGQAITPGFAGVVTEILGVAANWLSARSEFSSNNAFTDTDEFTTDTQTVTGHTQLLLQKNDAPFLYVTIPGEGYEGDFKLIVKVKKT
jgi:hypothetical protein